MSAGRSVKAADRIKGEKIMKKCLSVIYLNLCRLKPAVIGCLFLIPILNVCVYFIAGAITGCLKTADFPGNSTMGLLYMYAFGAALLLYAVIGAKDAVNKTSRYEYLLKRLCVSDMCQFLLGWLTFALGAMIIYLGETVTIRLIAYLNSLRDAYAGGPQGVYAGIMESTVLRSLLPLGSSIHIAKIVMMVILIGLLCACIQMSVLRGRSSRIISIIVAVAWFLSCMTGNDAAMLAFVVIAYAPAFLTAFIVSMVRIGKPMTIESDKAGRKAAENP